MPAPLSIESLRDALADPGVYPHDPNEVRLEQTHISIVALVPPRVYKIKKPVELGFLDFSTLENRRHYCKEEVRLNRRLCEDTYEGVVPIVDTDDGLQVDPERIRETDHVVEYAVKMKYLAPEHFLHTQVKQGATSAADVDRVAEALCSFYATRSSTPEVAEEGWIDRLQVNFDENFAQTAEHVGHALDRPSYEALRYYTDRFFDHNASLFHRRRAEGRIIDGHGDLRLEHVHLTDDRVCIYDCIEFNERFRHLDVANDVAFLAMDLDLHGRPDFSQRLVQRVANALDDPGLPALIDFYKCYRAYVRAKVEGMRAAANEVPPAERGRSRVRAHRYYQWALRYAVAGSAPLVVVIFGRSGTGKSTQARALAQAVGWPHVASDRVRKTSAGVPLHQRTDAAMKTQLYSDAMTDHTYDTLQTRALERATQHGGTVLDATYSDPDRRTALRDTLRDADVPYAFVELTAPDDVLRTRLRSRDAKTATASDARAEDFDLLDRRYQPPTALEDARHVRIDATGSPQDTTLAILKALIRLND